MTNNDSSTTRGVWTWFQAHCDVCNWIGTEHSFPDVEDAAEKASMDLLKHIDEEHYGVA